MQQGKTTRLKQYTLTDLKSKSIFQEKELVV
jgi:hypothetical protein